MQTRDYYLHDYTMKYYPKIDIESFQQDMYTLKRGRLDNVLFDSADLAEDSRIYDLDRNSQIASLVIGLSTVIFYNKIPLINRCQAKWKKFFFKVFLFFVPTTISGGFSFHRQNEAIGTVYTKHFDKYLKYKQVGDLRILNPNARISDD